MDLGNRFSVSAPEAVSDLAAMTEPPAALSGCGKKAKVPGRRKIAMKGAIH
jgi:hypothetical protein